MGFILTVMGSYWQTFLQSAIGTYLFFKDHSDRSAENRFHEGKNGIRKTNKEEIPAFVYKVMGVWTNN